jgi:phosphopantothenoylcysteine decarboxylase/phosphopantothenate--cysteine ligase
MTHVLYNMSKHLQGKKILLGISGSIAAYKAAQLTRLFVKAGAEVKIIMTPAATTFITPLTLSTLSKNPVWTEVSSEGGWNNHVDLGLWADVMIIAPATATTLSKLAHGLCDNMLVAVYLSARCPVFFAPAMDVDMWHHPSTQKNVQTLQSYGNRMIPVGVGELASGLTGEGRMAEPESIVELIDEHFNEGPLRGKRILVTAGPTIEALDPVRFLGNRSSGKMGIAVAEAAAKAGALVELILGPTHLRPQHPNIQLHRVESAEEMHREALACFPDCQAAVLAAAVADYRPKERSAHKIKKSGDQLHLELVRTPDIAASLGQQKTQQIIVGFAMETQNEKENALRKLTAKNMDFIVLNSLREEGAGFQHDTNKVRFIFKDQSEKNFELKLKSEVAEDIIQELIALIR